MKNLFVCLLLIIFSTLLFSKTDRKVLNGKNMFQQEKLNKQNPKSILEEKWNKHKELNPKLVSELTASRADSIIAISVSDTGLYRFWYDALGNVASYYRCTKNGSQWIYDYKYTYTYTASGKVKTVLNEYGELNKWLPSTRQTFQYDSNEYMISALTEGYDSTGWKNNYIFIYTRTATGLLSAYLVQEWDGTTWINNHKVEYQFDSKWQVILENDWVWEAGAWKANNTFSYTYNQFGDKIEEVSDYLDFWTSSRIKSRLTYSYNSKRQIIQELTERFNDSKWNNYSRISHNYEANDLVHKKITENWDDTAWVNYDFGIDTLDQNKRLSIYYYYYWENGNWIPYYRDHYKYNSKGNLLSLFDEDFTNNKWGKYYMEEYTYDAAGDLLINYNLTTWENDVPMSPPLDGSYIYVNIDSNELSSKYIAGYSINIWYKKVAIPVELASFTALPKDGFVQLKWQTATETNNKGFDVERKTGENQWINLGFVQGNGTTAESHNYSFVDKNSTTEKCSYRLKQIDFDGTVNYSPEIEVTSNVIKSYSLGQNYPNPFNPSTSISFAVPKESRVSVKIYNSVGQQVKELVSGVKPAGNYDVRFDASMLSSGVYFYTIEASAVNGSDNFRSTKKMMILK